MNATSKKFRILFYLSVVLGLCAFAFIGFEFFYLHPYWTYHAFRVASESMCPTICKGERVFVKMKLPETPYVLQRRDVIAMEFGNERNLWLERAFAQVGDNLGNSFDRLV